MLLAKNRVNRLINKIWKLSFWRSVLFGTAWRVCLPQLSSLECFPNSKQNLGLLQFARGLFLAFCWPFSSQLRFFFFFRLSLFGVATVHLLPPHPSVNHILLHNTHTLHILPHHIQPPLPQPSPFPSSRHLHLQCPSPYILRFSPFHMSVPPQPCSSNLLPQLSYSRRPSDILIPDLIFSCHPQRPPDHLQFCHLQLPHLLVRRRYNCALILNHFRFNETACTW